VPPEDAIQESFLEAWEARERLESLTGDQMQRWILTTLGRKYIDAFRAAVATGRKPWMRRLTESSSLNDLDPFDFIPSPGETPSGHVRLEEMANGIREALRQMTADQARGRRSVSAGRVHDCGHRGRDGP